MKNGIHYDNDKQREGQTGSVRLGFIKAFQQITPLDVVVGGAA